MILKIKHFVIFITIGTVLSCQRQPPKLSEISGKLLPIASSQSPDDSDHAFITPCRNRLNAALHSTLAVAAGPIAKTDGGYNSSMGNSMADIIFTEANRVYWMRTGHPIDAVSLNPGGIGALVAPGVVILVNQEGCYGIYLGGMDYHFEDADRINTEGNRILTS